MRKSIALVPVALLLVGLITFMIAQRNKRRAELRAPVAPLLLGSPTSTTEARPEPYIIRNRTKSTETIALSELSGWEADLRDRGHRRGYIITIRRAGEAEPVEIVRADGQLRSGARELAVGLLSSRESAT